METSLLSTATTSNKSEPSKKERVQLIAKWEKLDGKLICRWISA